MRSRNYCLNHNYEDMRNFTSWQVLRSTILKRDNYKCVKCGLKPNYFGDLIADHIEPIALGGDEWDEANIQSLCIPCDKRKTALDLKKIAELRAIEKKQEVNQTLS